MILTKHFKLEEMIFSEYAIRNNIDNTPSQEIINALRDTCIKVIEPLRIALNKPIKITSGYRSKELNKAIGGSKTSQHCFGEAVDLQVVGVSTEDLFQKIILMKLPYDQIIQEFNSWVHCSYRENPRREQLIAIKVKGKTIYEKL
jgi:uncharacterized protein YcbK (DUF882 family)